MAENATELAGPSLEDILWRAMDRFAERPAVLDAEEFAARIAGAFDGELPEEAFVDRFIEGNPEVARKADMAEAIVRSTPSRLHVYDFDLGRLDYVVIEEEEEVVVVSDFGQFALPNDRLVQEAIRTAVVRDRSGLERRAVDRASSEPRAYLVRQDGDLVVLDVAKLAAAVARLPVRQVSAPPVERPPLRLQAFDARPRTLTAPSEAKALREHDRRAALPVPRRRPADGGLDLAPIADARPSTAAAAVLVLLPDGTLARPEMGSAARWHRMVSDWALRAGLLASSGTSVGVSGSQRFTVDAGKVTAVFRGGESRRGPGSVGETAAARGDGLVAARADFAPVRVLADDELAQAVALGTARIVAGWSAPVATTAGTIDRYWMQPETIFSPTSDDRALVARADPAAGLDAPSPGVEAPSQPQMVAVGEPLQLGQITGDPWADWALQTSGGPDTTVLAATPLRLRPPAAIRIRGEPVIAFRAPDGTLVLNAERGPVRLAAIDRDREGGLPDGAALGDAAPSGTTGARQQRTSLARRAGALPATAIASLRLALERTAVAGGYKLPVGQLTASPTAIDAGRALRTGSDDPRRSAAALAAPPELRGGPSGKIARLVLSMPFPNVGEVHVGPDLSDALTAYLSAPVVPASTPSAARKQIAGATAEPAFAVPASATATSRARPFAVMGTVAPDTLLGPATAFAPRPQSLPPLLRHAVLASGEFRAGPGAPLILRDLPEGPAAVSPDLVLATPPEPALSRPLGPGEDEIVIPMPLWAQMGRGQATSTLHVMASPVARTAYAPPLGTYGVVRPAGFRLLDPEIAPPPGTPGMIEIAGPTAVRLRPRLDGRVRAEAAGGKLVLGNVPLDDARSLVGPRGRMRVGEPLDAKAVAERRAAIQQASAAPVVPARVPALSLPTQGAVRLPAREPVAAAARAALRTATELEGRALPARPPTAGGFVSTPPQLDLLGAQPSVTAAQGSRAAQDALSLAAVAPTGVEGLPPGAWSGAHPGSAGGYVPWSYSGDPRRVESAAVGGIDLSALPRPNLPSLPTGMRFRYVAAPLWWSSALRKPAADPEQRDSASRAVRSSARAATSAAAIWRSIFAGGTAADVDLSGGMDRRHDEPARDLSGIERRMDVLVALGLVGGGKMPAPAARAKGPETVYVAMDEQGRAGPATAGQLGRNSSLARPVEMRIVAAIPPSPPPLHAMGSAGAPARTPVLARQRHAPGGGEHKSHEAVSQSRIEGSVDAIAQRIYHSIRQRIARDRERFGG